MHPRTNERLRRSPRRPRSAALATLATLAAIVSPVVLGACGQDSTQEATPSTTLPAGTGTTMLGPDGGAPAADQTPPVGTNGLTFRNGSLWVADLAGRQIVVVDPADGTILARYTTAEGIDGQPDDLTVAPDGSVWWTAFDTGTVGKVDADGRSTTVATLRPGANAITTSPGGTIFVTAAVTGDGFWEIDPSGTAPVREIAAAIGNVNGFAFGPDGVLYGPSFADQKSKVVRIDVADGATTDVAEGFRFPTSVRFGPDGRAYVLSAVQPEVHTVDLATGEIAPFATPGTTAVDNMAWGPDGNLYVTAFAEPVVTVIGPDGAVVRTLTLGRR